MTLHERIAAFLGWSPESARGFSMRTLRDLVKTAPASKRRDELVADINALERSGRVVIRTGKEFL